MSDLITQHPKALQLLFTEDLYQIAPAVAAVSPAKEDEPAPIAAAAPQFDYLGENNRFYLLLVNETNQTYLESANRELLIKILQAKAMELKDVAILNINRYPGVSFMQLKAFFSCSRICLFDIDPQQLGLPEFPSNEPGIYEEVKVLATFSLKELQQTQHKKVAFWNAMKNF